MSIRAPGSKKTSKYIDLVPLRISIMYCHHFRSWMIWEGQGQTLSLGSLSIHLVDEPKTQPAPMTWEANCSFPIKDSSSLQDILALLHQASSSACISSTLSGDIEIVMSIVLNKIPKTTMTEEGGQALCSDSQTLMCARASLISRNLFCLLGGGGELIKVVGTKGFPGIMNMCQHRNDPLANIGTGSASHHQNCVKVECPLPIKTLV